MTKLRANDGALLATASTGGFPFGIVFDGANIWVTSHSGQVFKLRMSDGVTILALNLGGDIRGTAFDGANVWVTDIANALVRKL